MSEDSNIVKSEQKLGPKDPMTGKATVVSEELSVDKSPVREGFSFDKNTVFMVLYFLYKTHVIQRNHLKSILREIGEKSEEDIVKYLVEEGAKG